jgi:hypothetical protein
MMAPRRLIWSALVLVALAVVFLMYTRADFMVDMANQLWSCF